MFGDRKDFCLEGKVGGVPGGTEEVARGPPNPAEALGLYQQVIGSYGRF